ncbi:MAG: HD domain-containing protein [Clostridia bacterium]|nr:HD domain-containing protein [Clostridia bacterium]
MLSQDVKTAQKWAERLHQGQVDKSGKPYIGHPARVAGRLHSPEAQVVGWLHDTVEDTGLALSDIEKEFGPETAEAVDAISRRAGEDWDAYLLRVKKNPIARQVKISDLIDNSNLSRLENVTLGDVERQAKYNRALAFLLTD